MNSSVYVVIGFTCLGAGVGLCVVSFAVRNDVIGWFSRAGLLLLIVGGVLLRKGRRRGDKPVRDEIGGAQRRFLLMLLRRSAARLNAQALEAAARSAWERRFGPNHDSSNYVESGEEEFGFVIHAYGNAFMVLETQKGVRDLKQPTRIYPESAIGIWSDYSHELSVGLAYNFDTDANRLSALVGTLSAALADAETLGILHPDSGQLWRLNQDTINRLTADPEAFFGSEPANSVFP
jgi:hypothetical protein